MIEVMEKIEDAWFWFLEMLYYHPIATFAAISAICLVIGVISWLIERMIEHIRFKRWAKTQVWYVKPSGLYRKKR